jgi:hypothetical protein
MTTYETFALSNFRGDTLDLSDTDVLFVSAYDGFGMAPVQRITQEGPYQHGATQLNARLQPRVITLQIAHLIHTTNGPWIARNNLLDMLADPDHDLYFDVDTPYRSWFLDHAYRINVRYLDSLTLPRAAQHDGFDRYVLQLIAHDPTWYNPEAEVVALSVTAGSTGMEIPLAIPFTLGGTDVDVSDSFTYPGTWQSYPIVRITGPIEDAVLTVVADDDGNTEKLDFTGTTIAAVDTRYGYKTVTDAAGTNKIGDLTADSDLATFCIRPAPTLEDGINTFRLTGTSATAATSCTITYYNRYIGI